MLTVISLVLFCLLSIALVQTYGPTKTTVLVFSILLVLAVATEIRPTRTLNVANPPPIDVVTNRIDTDTIQITVKNETAIIGFPHETNITQYKNTHRELAAGETVTITYGDSVTLETTETETITTDPNHPAATRCIITAVSDSRQLSKDSIQNIIYGEI